MSLLSATGAYEKAVYDETVLMHTRYEELLQLYAALKKIDEQKCSDLHGDYVGELTKRYTALSGGPLKNKYGAPGGPCLAGSKRAFVDVCGGIYPCEKVTECEELRIGTIYDGFDISRIDDILNISKSTEEECKKCWAFMFCTACIAASIGPNGISRETRLANCKAVREGAIEQLKSIKLLEENGFRFDRYWREEDE